LDGGLSRNVDFQVLTDLCVLTIYLLVDFAFPRRFRFGWCRKTKL